MNDELKFTLNDCDDVVRQCLQLSEVHLVDFEVIPRHGNNFIFKITFELECKEETLYFYAKAGHSKIPKIDKIIYEDFKSTVPGFNPKITPKFYCGKSELSFFEDLTCQKFQTYTDFYDLKHIQQVLKVLAEFHAAAFAHEETQEPRCKLKEKFDLEDSNFDLEKTHDVLWSLVEHSEKIAEVKNDLQERQSSSKFAKTLCHSNLTSTNILFHYNHGTPDDCKLINFKSKLYASPLYDVLQMLFFNTDADFRRNHFETALLYYHNRLEEKLRNFKLDVDKILPLKDLKSASHLLLPLIKLETLQKKQTDPIQKGEALKELKEILSFPCLTREDCYSIVKNIIESSDYKLLSFNVSSSNLQITILHSLEEKTINCFVRCFPKKEIFIYETFIPKLQELGITAINDCVPRCYFQRPEDLLVFEDLSVNHRQFRNPFDFTLLSIVMKKLAQFHGGNLVFEEKMSRELKTTYRVTNDYSQDLLSISDANLVESAVNLMVSLFPNENLKKCLPKLTDTFCKSFTPSEGFRNVLSHGNLQTKNILIKFEDDKPIDCRFVDFQSIRYCPPAHDFLSVLYLTTDRATRIKNEEELKQIYYNNLGTIISSYNYNVNNFFSYQEFVDGVEDIRSQVVIQAILSNIGKAEEISSLLDNEDNLKDYLAGMCEKSEKLKENMLDLYEICNYMLPNL